MTLVLAACGGGSDAPTASNEAWCNAVENYLAAFDDPEAALEDVDSFMAETEAAVAQVLATGPSELHDDLDMVLSSAPEVDEGYGEAQDRVNTALASACEPDVGL